MEMKMNLEVLKRDAQRKQKKGLPFIMSSVVIWTMILGVQFLDKPIGMINFLTFSCSCMLLPLSFMFSKLLKAEVFKKTDNPISKLGFLCTMNQMLYILIVMWAFNQKPEAMVMLYAMVFGAHLFPFGWVYDSKAYGVISVVETIGALVVNVFFGNMAMICFMVVMEIILSLLLWMDVRKERQE